MLYLWKATVRALQGHGDVDDDYIRTKVRNSFEQGAAIGHCSHYIATGFEQSCKRFS
jgi:hypothetical protein